MTSFRVSASTTTATLTIETGTTGISPSAVGGIAAGIVGAFIIIGAVIAFVLFRTGRPTRYVGTQYPDLAPMEGPVNPQEKYQGAQFRSINQGDMRDSQMIG
jgi:hypothetical protein